MGDPTGVGPELIVKALLDGALDECRRPLVVYGDAAVLARAACIFAEDAAVRITDGLCWLRVGGKSLQIKPVSNLPADELVYGEPDTAAGKAMADYVEEAVQACLGGVATGMVTCPINKAAINAAGVRFPGHTELLAERCGVDKVVMMLAGERLKVCLVTTHLAYRDVPGLLNKENILQTMRIVDRSFRDQFGFVQPKLAVAALNPHAGEQGLFGDEEIRLIAPAIADARAEGLDACGPFAPDTLFHFAARGDYDAVICMYHDQGLIPLKLLHFEDAVNVTLGLPIIRTSVDHGTAYDLAGTGTANTASLVAAINMAESMSKSL
jgi:4-hydroxythreonine-4-phosphate dehydrogenase